MTELFTNISVVVLLTRMVTTALIVIFVASAVGKLGPIGGGLIAGLPIGFGPGFYFLLDGSSTDFLIQTATFSLLSLSATQFFLTTYIATAKLDFPIASLAIAALIWVVAIAVLAQFPVATLSSATLFIGATVLTYQIGRRFKIPKTEIKRREGIWVLICRAALAGLIVAVVTILAPKLGAELAGVLLAFPIGYAFISMTVHQQYGSANVIDVLHSALLGTIGLAFFCGTFAFALHTFSQTGAFLLGLTASLAATSLMMVRSQSRLRKLSMNSE